MKKGGIAPHKVGQGQSTLRSQLTNMKRKIMRRGLPPRAQRSVRNTAQRQQVHSNTFFGSIGRALRRK